MQAGFMQAAATCLSGTMDVHPTGHGGVGLGRGAAATGSCLLAVSPQPAGLRGSFAFKFCTTVLHDTSGLRDSFS